MRFQALVPIGTIGCRAHTIFSPPNTEKSVSEQSDFPKYNTPEIVESRSELISVSGKVQQVFITAVFGLSRSWTPKRDRAESSHQHCGYNTARLIAIQRSTRIHR